MSYVVAALYQFVTLEDHAQMREPLLAECKRLNIIGTLLLAREGINGTIAGSREGIDAILAYLRSDARLSGLEHKESFTTSVPFKRMKVRLKKEIVTLGVPGIDPNEKVGTYVSPEQWNELINDPSVIVIDTRNDYEVQAGTFKNAINPRTRSFRQFPDFVKSELGDAKNRKIAMCCTGGIRCEKASSYMLEQGFKEVYHLKGGILKYLEEVPSEQSLWEGDCFVFDDRGVVGHGDF
jgi:UPF0176 protein